MNLSSRKLTIYLPEVLVKSIRIACVNHDTTLTSVFTDLAESYVAKPFTPKSRDRRKARNRKGAAV